MITSSTKHIFIVIMYFVLGIILLYALTNDITQGFIRDSLDTSFNEQFNEHTLDKGTGLTEVVEQSFDNAVEITE